MSLKVLAVLASVTWALSVCAWFAMWLAAIWLEDWRWALTALVTCPVPLLGWAGAVWLVDEATS